MDIENKSKQKKIKKPHYPQYSKKKEARKQMADENHISIKY